VPLQLDDLGALDAPTAGEGRPMPLPLDAIDEDSAQPRHEFDANALLELAATMRDRGVRQPISVRPNLKQAGRWVLNFGARRLRAAKLAGLSEIPAFVDTTADDYDQVIENEQREGLTALELALFVQKRLASGDSKADIARKLGKSRQYITVATALIEAPAWLLEIYRLGRCRGRNELYELRRLHGEHPQQVEAWASGSGAITREQLSLLRDELSDLEHRQRASVGVDGRESGETAATSATQAAATRATVSIGAPMGRRPARHRQFSKRLHVEFDGQDFQLVVSVAPAQESHLYIRPLAGGPRRLAPASALKLRGFVGR